MERGLQEYTEPERREKRARRGIGSMDMVLLSEILEQNQARPCFCPACGMPLEPTPWTPRGEGRFMATAACEEHGEYVLKLRIQEGEEGTYVLTRTLRTMDDDARAQMEKSGSRRKKRRRRRGKGGGAAPVEGE